MGEPQPSPQRAASTATTRVSRMRLWRGTLVYLAVGALWIALTHRYLGTSATVTGLGLRPSELSFAGFIVVSACAVFGLMRRLGRRQQGIDDALETTLAAHERALGLLQAISDGSPDVIYAKDAQGRYLVYNAAAARAIGREPSSVLGLNDDLIFRPEEAFALRANDQQVMAGNRVDIFDEVLDTTSGRRTFQAIKGPLHDREGRVTGVFGMSRDVTAQRAAETALRQSESRYRLLFKSNPQPMWLFDRETLRFMAVNLAAIEHYGYTREQFMAMTISDIRPEGEDSRLRQRMASETHAPDAAVRQFGIWKHRCSDGRLIDVEVSGTHITLDDRPVSLVLAHDVTQRLALERQQQADHRAALGAGNLLRDVMSRVGDGFVAVDKNWRYTYLNPQAATMLGRQNPDDLLGCNLWDEFPEVVGQPFHQAHLQAMATQKPTVVEGFYKPWGSWFESRIYPMPEGLSIYFTNITARRQAEQALRQSELRFRLAAAGGQVWDWDIERDLADFPAPFWANLGHAAPLPADNIRRLAELMHPQDRARWVDLVHTHLRDRKSYRFDFRVRHAQGDWRWFHTQGQSVWNEQGRATYMAGTAFEITERKQVAAALMESQAELSELAQQLLAQEKNSTQRFAQALHDHLGQTLAVARLNLDACIGLHAAQMPEAMRAQSAHIAALLGQAVGEVRQILADLRPPKLEELGLAAALESEIASHSTATGGPDVLLELADGTDARRWPANVEYGAFMVTREAVTNARLHGHASLIRVVLSGDEQSLSIHTIDDGNGMPAPLLRGRPGHLGIVGMRERALAIGAQFAVVSQPGAGTRVSLEWRALPKGPA